MNFSVPFTTSTRRIPSSAGVGAVFADVVRCGVAAAAFGSGVW